MDEAASVESDTEVSLGFFCSLGISIAAKALSKESLLESSEDICSCMEQFNTFVNFSPKSKVITN